MFLIEVVGIIPVFLIAEFMAKAVLEETGVSFCCEEIVLASIPVSLVGSILGLLGCRKWRENELDTPYLFYPLVSVITAGGGFLMGGVCLTLIATIFCLIFRLFFDFDVYSLLDRLVPIFFLLGYVLGLIVVVLVSGEPREKEPQIDHLFLAGAFLGWIDGFSTRLCEATIPESTMWSAIIWGGLIGAQIGLLETLESLQEIYRFSRWYVLAGAIIGGTLLFIPLLILVNWIG